MDKTKEVAVASAVFELNLIVNATSFEELHRRYETRKPPETLGLSNDQGKVYESLALAALALANTSILNQEMRQIRNLMRTFAELKMDLLSKK